MVLAQKIEICGYQFLYYYCFIITFKLHFNNKLAMLTIYYIPTVLNKILDIMLHCCCLRLSESCQVNL